MNRTYLDHNATTPLNEAVLEEMLPFLTTGFGNPSSIHAFGLEARRAVDKARTRVADFLNATPAEVVFTSGGTESDNQALRGVFELYSGRAFHLVTSAVEHPAIIRTCEALETLGASFACVPVDAYGAVDPRSIEDAITDETGLITVMLANNDVGTIQPLREICEIGRTRGIPTHSDAVQAPGKIPLDVNELDVDLMSLSGHKFNGPKGTGALYVRSGSELPPLIFGGEQERGRRAGTENVAGIVGFGKACELAAHSEEKSDQIRSLRDRFERGLRQRFSGTRVNGHPTNRLPNTSNVIFESVGAGSLQMNLDLVGIAVSAGSACASGAAEPSHVLTAMGVDRESANSALRFSFGAGNTDADVDRTLDALAEIVARLRTSS